MSIYSSVSKYIGESAQSSLDGADNLVKHIKKTHDKVTIPDECYTCRSKIPYFDISNLRNQNKCRMCSRSFCINCLIKSNFDIPNHLLDISFQNKTKVISEKQLICKQTCLILATTVCMSAFCADIKLKFEENLNTYLSSETIQKYFYPIPKECPEDTAYRKAIRAAHIAGYVADLTGFSFTYKALKYAYYSSELINILTDGGMLAILNPLLEQLKIFGITGPTALIRLYYLGCQHTLTMKTSRKQRCLEYQADQPGVLLSECPYHVLEYIKQYLSPAQWQYCSNLPPPHHENDWGNWYLSQLIRRQGWTLILSVNESTKIPNGFKCPAFALVARCYPSNNDPSSMIKECMLVIRGSKSTLDWSINLGEAMDDFAFTRIVSNANTHSTLTTSGHVHKGIYNSAIAILECYNLKNYLIRMLESDYQLKVVGHSLGAGVSVLIAAELRSTLISLHIRNTTQDVMLMEVPTLDVIGNKSSKQVPIDGSVINLFIKTLTNSITAIVFSSPACITMNLADAFLADKLLINTVYDMDVIPRFSFKTLEILSEELKDPEFVAKADAWTNSDKSAFTEYASSMGKAGNIIKTIATTAAVVTSTSTVGNDTKATVTNTFEKQTEEEPLNHDISTTPQIVDKDSSNEINEKANVNISSIVSTIGIAKGWLSSYRANNNPVSIEIESNKFEQQSIVANIDNTNNESNNSKIPDNEAVSIIDKVPRIHTVTPGPIVHLYAENNGTINAAVVNHMHPSFERMTIIPAYITEDHFIPRTREALRTLLHNYRMEPNKINTNNLALADQYFSIPQNFGGNISEKNYVDYIYCSIEANKDSVINDGKEHIVNDDAIQSDETLHWEPCSVCGIDATWPYVLNSDASRAIITHNCRCCGKVVCSLCSPSGDSLPGDGVNQSYPLSDYRITLPHLGLFSPQRVCLHCYFDA